MSFKFTSIMAQLIGPPGTGKSQAAASFYPTCTPERPFYVFDLTSKIDALKAAFPEAFEQGLITYDTYRVRDFEKIYQKLNFIQRQPQNKRPKAISMDDLSAMNDMLLDTAFDIRSGKEVKGVDIDEPGDYKFMARAITKLLNAWREPEFEDIHRFLITHEYEVRKDYVMGPKAGQTEFTRYTLIGGSKLGPKIPGYFNEVYEFRRKAPLASNQTPKFFIRTSPDDDSSLARSIIPEIPSEIEITRRKENPTGSLWFELEKILKGKGYI